MDRILPHAFFLFFCYFVNESLQMKVDYGMHSPVIERAWWSLANLTLTLDARRARKESSVQTT